MGYMRNHCIVVTCYGSTDGDMPIIDAHKKAIELFQHLVSNIVESTCNGMFSFFIAPDGSKEGWDTSDYGNCQRDNFIKWLRDKSYDWAEIQYGDEEGITKVIRHSDEYE